jgi:hypothetical protein
MVSRSPERNRPIDLAVCGNFLGQHAVNEHLLAVIDQLACNQRGARRIISVGKRFQLFLSAYPVRDQSLIELCLSAMQKVLRLVPRHILINVGIPGGSDVCHRGLQNLV